VPAPDPKAEAQILFEQSRDAHTARDTSRAIELARHALAFDEDHVEALEHLATLLITRRRHYSEGLGLIERAAALRYDDAGVWYALGWLYEFAAHEIARRDSVRAPLDVRTLYERAAEAFRQCLALNPEGKLEGDAEDLLDHVENELASMRP
jgi:tetratricopeptide (TPR) repeat protein